ncbi:hypothetical protein WI97_07295 [Burkholderia vietnamiensis]|nr:hypothetical protein WI97_07295 [Burkholderia vietnamiensis]
MPVTRPPEETEMADLLEGTLPLNLVAIDIARYSNAVLIELSDGKRQRFRMTNSAPDFDQLLSCP